MWLNNVHSTTVYIHVELCNQELLSFSIIFYFIIDFNINSLLANTSDVQCWRPEPKTNWGNSSSSSLPVPYCISRLSISTFYLNAKNAIPIALCTEAMRFQPDVVEAGFAPSLWTTKQSVDHLKCPMCQIPLYIYPFIVISQRPGDI